MWKYERLLAWRRAQSLAVAVTKASLGLPAPLQGSLGEQLRRSALSVPSNIAEGSAGSKPQYRRHVRIALGSAKELESQLQLYRDLPFCEPAVAHDLVQRATEVKRLLIGLLRSLR
ncbi:MAG: four helix bundle protein [Planctomycetota bacterium]|jgi:four helix bundle protein